MNLFSRKEWRCRYRENGPVDAVGRGESWMNGENRIDIYTVYKIDS